MTAESVIYLSGAHFLCSETAYPILDTAWPTSVHYLPDSYRGAGLGLSSPPHRLVDQLCSGAEFSPVDDLPAEKQALIFATGNGIFAATQIHKQQPGGRFDYSSKVPALQMTQIYAGRLAQRLGTTGHIVTDSSACASSMKALMDAVTLIRYYGFERVAILAVEDQVSLGMLEFFGKLHACLLAEELALGILPSAFDAVNRGFLLGQGAAFVWLESECAIQSSGRRPWARVCSAVSCGEVCASPIGQDLAGSGFIRAMHWALERAQVKAAAIDLVKAHGTGTLLNNQAEAAALAAVFGQHFIATTYKQHIGHTLGTSGLLETLLAIEDARQGRIRGIANRTSEHKNFPAHDLAAHPQYLLSLAAGMGNIYAAAVLEILYER